MSNDLLVELVKTEQHYLNSGPRTPKVLEALRRVNRIDFIPPSLGVLCLQEEGDFIPLAESLELLAKDPERKGEVVDAVVDAATQLVDELRYPVHVPWQILAYLDIPISIGYNQTCSQPSMVAFMADVLELKPGMKVLEIGTGCGYHAAVTAELVGNSGRVYSVERLPGLVSLARRNLQRHFGKDYGKRVTVIQGDGSLGFSDAAPFDAIYLTAGVTLTSFDPGSLAVQLKLPAGTLLYPEALGNMTKEVYGQFGGIERVEFFKEVSFVPLRGKNAKEVPQFHLLPR